MAKVIEKQFTVDLGTVVNNAIDSYVTQRKNEYIKTENKFIDEVLSNGMSYDQQLAWYEDFVKRLQSANFPDSQYLQEVQQRMAMVKKNLRYHKFNEKMRQATAKYNAQKISIDDYIQQLENQKLNTTDPALLDTINKQIDTATASKIELENTALRDRVTWQNKVGNISTLSKNLNDLQRRKASLVATNNNPVLNTLLDNLINQTQREIVNRKVTSKLFDFNRVVSTSTNPIDVVNTINNYINEAGTDIPVTINNQFYNSERDYWNKEKINFLTNPKSGFIPMLTKIYGNQVNTLSDTGLLTVDALSQINNQIKSLEQSPDIQPILPQLESFRTDILNKSASSLATKIIDEYNTDTDYTKAMTKLNKMYSLLGTDISGYQNQLIRTQAEANLSDIQDYAKMKNITYAQAKRELEANPQLTSNQAFTPVNLVKKESPQVEKPTPPPATPTTSTPTTSNQPPVQEYTVGKGDTLPGLAKKFNTTLAEIEKLNPDIGTRNWVGFKLKLPKI